MVCNDKSGARVLVLDLEADPVKCAFGQLVHLVGKMRTLARIKACLLTCKRSSVRAGSTLTSACAYKHLDDDLGDDVGRPRGRIDSPIVHESDRLLLVRYRRIVVAPILRSRVPVREELEGASIVREASLHGPILENAASLFDVVE